MANYNITISPLQIPNTSYAEVPLPVYGKKIKLQHFYA